MAKKKEKSGEFEFTGEMSAAAVTGLEFRDSFSPSESLDGMLAVSYTHLTLPTTMPV